MKIFPMANIQNKRW